MAIYTWHEGEVPEGTAIKQVYGLIFTEDGKLLLRVEEKAGRFKYSLAGGKPEPADNGLEATLRRELAEEINVSIYEPKIVGYQLVDEENGEPPFAQVRMVAMVDEIGEARSDPDSGNTYWRTLASPLKAAELLGWGEVGHLQIEAAMRIAAEAFGITEFS
jgi:ADP-ribose pyrophosphatase YjhB (NUDIX family)